MKFSFLGEGDVEAEDQGGEFENIHVYLQCLLRLHQVC